MKTAELQTKSSQSELSNSDRQSTLPPLDAEMAPQKTPIANGDANNGTGSAPDGGLEAWLVAAGSFCIFFCCLGFSNSFGALADYYITHQLVGRSADDIAWIGSVSAYLQFFSGMIGGPLFDRFGVKVCRHISIDRMQ